MTSPDVPHTTRFPVDLYTELESLAASMGLDKSDVTRRAVHTYVERCGRQPEILQSVREAKECKRRNVELEARVVELEKQLAATRKAADRAQAKVDEIDQFTAIRVRVGNNTITYQDSLAMAPRLQERLQDLVDREDQGLFVKLGQDPCLAAPPVLRPLYLAHKSWAAALAVVVA